jgi:hypothetical protein
VSKVYKKPDLNAPRYRPKKLNLTNAEIYKKFIEENPYVETICLDKFKEVVKTFNGKIWNSVIENRDGVELPEQLGYIFIGSCPKKKGDNTNYKKSEYYGVKLQNQNWESDQYTAKIFYTNFDSKYKFRNHDLWGFAGVRDFKRNVGKTYPNEWKKYVMVDNMVKVSRIFRKESFIQFKNKETKDLLQDYDEFNLD